MAKSVVIDEIHVTIHVADNLPNKPTREVRQTLNTRAFTNRLRKAIRKVIKDFPELAPVTVSIAR